MKHSDLMHRCLFEGMGVRGELVQLHDSIQKVLENHDYPPAVQTLLGELMVAASLLTATIKFEGSISVQLQGDGPVRLAVINGDHDQKLRGVARYEGNPEGSSIAELIGNGHLVITITPTKGERYQGVVALSKPSLAACIEDYFNQSEQLPTRLWLHAAPEGETPHLAAGMLLQVLPSQQHPEQQDFEHLQKLTETITEEELLTLAPNELLYRLYHQEEVQVFEPQPVAFFCGCSKERSAGALKMVESKELDEILKLHGKVELNCEYCGANYQFDALDVQALKTESGLTPQNFSTKSTTH